MRNQRIINLIENYDWILQFYTTDCRNYTIVLSNARATLRIDDNEKGIEYVSADKRIHSSYVEDYKKEFFMMYDIKEESIKKFFIKFLELYKTDKSLKFDKFYYEKPKDKKVS